MQRILNIETISHIGKEVNVRGWVNSRRDHGKIVFIDLRDNSGILQVVCQASIVEGVREEFVLSVLGKVKERPNNMINSELATGNVELEAEKVEVLAGSEILPFEVKDKVEASLPIVLDFRALSLRNEKIKAAFKVEEQVIYSFRDTLRSLRFTEIQVPCIVPTATEGGAEVFKIDYYGRPAYLGQSPQFYKQIMVGVFERVYTLAHAFRAEPSVTTRHLAEYVGLDAEMGFIDSWEDLMDTCEKIIKDMFFSVSKNCQQELKIFGSFLPEIQDKIPRIKMRDAQKIILERTGRDNTKEPDLEPEDEKEICKWAKEKYASELVFITHYPTKKRPFYTYPDPANPDYTLSFDLLCRGLEVVTGGQRINNYQQLLENVKKWGNKPESFELYLQAFKFGMPPEGGFCLGAERIAKQILNLENLREASLFPRDMGRIDQRLSEQQ